MATILNADNITGGLIATGDSSGILQLQSSGTSVLTLNTTQALGVGSSPAYGTAGQFLTSQGSAASPAWTSVPASAMTLISTQTANNTGSLTWAGLSGYNNYYLIFDNLIGDGGSLICLLGTGSTPTYQTSNYNDTFTYISGTTQTIASNIGASYIQIASGGVTTSPSGLFGYGNFGGFLSTTSYKNFIFRVADWNGAVNVDCFTVGCYVGTTSTPITAIKLSTTFGGVMVSGTASLYGISS